MGRAFKREFAAAVLVEALYSTDAAACEKYGVTRQTLYRYRERLSEDAELLHIVTTKKAALDKAWADDLPVALKKGIRLIAECADSFGKDEQIFKRNPELIHALAGAVKVCADVYYTGKLIDARITPPDRQPAGLLGEEPADAESRAVN